VLNMQEVAILATADDARQVSRCYELACSVCVPKPMDYAQFACAIHNRALFLSVVTVPPEAESSA